MKKTWPVMCRVVVTTSLTLPIGCKSSQERARQVRTEAAREVVTKSNFELVNLIARYRAITGWEGKLKESDYTIDLEPLFVRSDERPIFFYGTLEDIRHENEKTFLYFSTTPTEGEPVLRIILDCGSCDLISLKRSSENVGDFGVIARITTMAKSLDVPENAPEYTLHGQFLTARYVGDYAFDKAIAHKQSVH